MIDQIVINYAQSSLFGSDLLDEDVDLNLYSKQVWINIFGVQLIHTQSCWNSH